MKSYTFIVTVLLIFSILVLSGCPQSDGDNNGTNGDANTDNNNHSNDTNNGTNNNLPAGYEEGLREFYSEQQVGTLSSFIETNNPICTQDGKPVVFLFTSTGCPYCNWVKDTFDKVAKEYVDADKIVAYHWQLDLQDNLLTDEVEGSFPNAHMRVFASFNKMYTIPTFVFGCKYYRIGTAYQYSSGLEGEEDDFRQVLDAIVLP